MECCTDTAVLIMSQLSELDNSIAYFFVSQIVSLIWMFERKPLSKPEPIFFAFYHCLKLSPALKSAAKDKELVNKLIFLLQTLYPDLMRSCEPKQNPFHFGQDVNLNNLISLIVDPQTNTTNNYVNYQSQQQFQIGGGNALESLKSSVRGGGVSSRNANISPTKNTQDERQPARLRQTRQYYSNTRANSEQPQELINQKLQIPEEIKESQIQTGEQLLTQEEAQRINVNQQQKMNPGSRVPPIMVDQIKQNSNPPPVLSGFQSTSTSVMNNFFNMPHGERFQMHHSAVRATSSATKTSLYKYQNQSMLAQTRLTRRQFSISRGGQINNNLKYDTKSQNNDINKIKMNQSPNIMEQNPYSDESLNNNRAKSIGAGGNLVPSLNLNQVKSYDNQKPKSIERQNSTYANVQPLLTQQQISEDGDDQDASLQLETQLLGAGQSAEQKLKQLALQLGESCLTNDLAALVSQKREIDLAMTARKVVHKPEFVKQMTMVVSQKRSNSQVTRANSSYLVIQRSRISQELVIDEEKLIKYNEINRLIILNLIDLILQDYSIEEARFSRKLTNLFTNYLNSGISREYRREIKIQELLNGTNFKKQHKNSNSSDPEYRYIYWSLLNKKQNQLQSQELLKKNQRFDQNILLIQSIWKSNYSDQQSQCVDMLKNAQDLFNQCKLITESRVILRILQKFSFVNEDILKTQSVNELSSFTARESNTYYQQSSNMLQNPNFIRGNSNYTSLNGQFASSPLKSKNNRYAAFDTGSSPTTQLRTNNLISYDCISQISNPYQLWSNNGIGYDISQGKDKQTTFIAQSHIKRKLDGVLYQVNRRIIFLFNQGFEITSFDFADGLTAEITALTTYIEDHSSRFLLQQFIDVCLEPIFMVKKALIEVTLEMRIITMDLTKPTFNGVVATFADTVKSGKNKSMNSDLMIDSENIPQNNQQTHQDITSQGDEVRFELLRCQRRLRDLFSEFLLLISLIIKRAQSEETLKLLNEVFIFDEVWNESVKAFTISLFLADLVAPLYQKDLSQHQLDICESLRGINLINFEEKSFFDSISQLNDQTLIHYAKEATYNYFIQAVSVLKYLNSITKFFEQINQIYFSKTFEPKNKAKGVPTDTQNHITEPIHYNSLVGNSLNNAAGKMSLQQSQGPLLAGDSQDKQTQKYWKHVIRRVLYQLMYLIVQPNGLFYLYLQKNCLNYSKQENQGATNRPQNQKKLIDQTAINLKITTNVLVFLHNLFQLPFQFTKYVFVEELMLFYIRTHYISFVKLYNKNYKKVTENSKDPGVFIPSMELCKRHVECLFAIAKQRTDDTRRKLYQFKICYFLLQEIGLEYELQQRQKQFLKLRQQEQTKLSKPTLVKTESEFKNQKSPELRIEKAQSQIPQQSTQQNQPVLQQSKTMIPKLKIGGLGFSTLMNENGKTQEEMDVENLVNQNKQPVQTVQQTQQDMPQPILKKVPFIPSLKVGGLGFSTLIKDNGKTQEELDVEAQVKQNNIKSTTEKIDQNNQKPQSFQEQNQPMQQKKLPFIPSLKVGGLGFSTLIKDGGKTQEEIDVEKLVKQPPTVTKPIQNVNSDVTDDSDDDFQILVHESARSRQQNPHQTKNQDGEGSSSSDESYYKELERLKSLAPPPPKSVMNNKPGFKLSLGGLGLSTLMNENGKTQEELDVDATVNQGKQFGQKIPEKMKTIEESQPKIFSRNTNFDKSEPTKVMKDLQVNQNQLNQMRASVEMQAPQREGLLNYGRSPDIISGFDQSQMSSIMHNNNQTKATVQKLPLASVISQLQAGNQLNMNIDDLMEAQDFAREEEIAPQPSQQLLAQQINITEEMLYLNERKVRPIYQDEELHILMLSLMMCLLLKPQRGTLDELYCSQFPIDNENQNFLYLLHFHLSHPQNQDIVPRLLQKMESLSPQLAGQRLLKLLCPSLFDLSLYGNGKGWIKLAEGAYGVVYEVQTNMAEPKTVAVKRMNLPQSIYDRCVLHDIFTEITCLEEFRLESSVTDLYDYGVDDSSYYIIMKKYSGSLRDWRLKQSPAMQDNLSLYLSIYREILKCFKKIHSHNVTHYDIKGDNILIDFITATNQSKQDLNDSFAITVGDFGECHMYITDKDEFQQRNRGTEHIKSPEMLQLAIATRKDTDKYDRRKRVGTNSLSDVWGLGCLFYELLTGDVLFNTEEYFEFHVRLTQNSQQLIQSDKLEKINNNVYLIDFLKYVLVRDIQLRPTIDNVLKRFEHIHALLVATSSANSRFNGRGQTENIESLHTIRGSRIQLSTLLERAAIIMENDGKAIEVDQLLSYSASGGSQTFQEVNQIINNKNEEKNEKHMPEMMRIMEDVFISSNFWLQRRSTRAIKLGITHVVIDKTHNSRQIKDMFQVLELNTKSNNAFQLVSVMMDFLRKVALFKGRVLFVEGKEEWNELSFSNHSLTEAMLICLAAVYQTTAYESYTLIKSQNLFFKIDTQRLIEISNFVKLCDQAQTYLATYPQFSCVCGACVIILKRSHATYQNMPIITCRCCHYYKNVESSQCPSTGCNDLVNFLQTYYFSHVQKYNMLPDGKLHWGFVRSEDFMIGPNRTGCTSKPLLRQVAMNLSQTIDINSQVIAITEKINIPDQLSSTSMRQKYSRAPLHGQQNHKYNQVHQAPQLTATLRETNQWKLMNCSQCSVWTHAYNEQEDRYAILLNNRLKDTQKEQKLGLLTRVNGDLLNQQPKNQAVRVPILKKIKLQTPF